MRILVAHNRYQQPGGEDVVFENETAMLEEAGHDVHRYEVHNDLIASVPDKLRTFLTTPYSRSARQAFEPQLESIEPDIVHVHNYFPLLTPAVFYACSARGIPVVHTVHNYRTMCANGLLLRNGRICEKCVAGSPFWAAAHRCYRGSLAGSVAVARMIDAQRRWGTWQHHVTRFIALTEFQREKLVEAGLPRDKICIKRNFVPDPGLYDSVPATKRAGALYVGRLSEEKGLRDLLDAWREMPVPLRIAGDGPLLGELREMAPENVTLLGRLQSAQVHAEMAQAKLLVMPSQWYEGLPVTLVEAFACGLPVAASRIGSLRDLVQDGETGVTFEPNDVENLKDSLRQAFADPDKLMRMASIARDRYEKDYTRETNLVRLVEIYEDACAAPAPKAAESGSRERPEEHWERGTAHSRG